MPDEEIDLGEFLEELVSILEKRLSRQDREIAKLRRELSALRPSGRVPVDSSVLKVLRGK